ncbi:hypothetical protein GIB67_014077 [Kingdonia uniflora]|uniref:Uncharacterized protein n=1 Tax=Kingdonia uniflora TaxID=39325 RepID=A0A7J7KXG7_9MAGN|nr:hypothetical protein GIB67_014077 [Kingdonia uniflora]
MVFQPLNYFQNYLFHVESIQHSQSNANVSIPVEAVAPQKENGKGRTERTPVKQRQSVDPECPTRRSSGSTKSQWYTLNAQCVAYKGIVAQERFRNSSGKTEEDRENDVHKIYQDLNGGNDFIHREAYKILVREPRWANLRDDGLNYEGNIPINVARRTSNNSSSGIRSD